MANIAVDANDVINELTSRMSEGIRENAILSLQVQKLSAQVDDLTNQLAAKAQANPTPVEQYPTATDSGATGQAPSAAGQ